MATVLDTKDKLLAAIPTQDQSFANSPARIETLDTRGAADQQSPVQKLMDPALYQRTGARMGRNFDRDTKAMGEYASDPANIVSNLPGIGPVLGAGMKIGQAVHANAVANKAKGLNQADAATDSAATGTPDGSPEDMSILGQIQDAQSGSAQFGMDKDAATADVDQLDAQNRQALARQDQANREASQADRDAIEGKQHLEEIQGKENAKVHGAMVQAATDYQNKMDQIAQESEIATKAALDKVISASQAAQNFQFKDFWASRSTMGTVMGIFAATMGGLANGAAGQPGAPTALDRVIAQDLELQKLQYSKLQNNVGNARSYFQDLVQQTGSLRAAEQAHYQAVSTKMQAMLLQAADKTSDMQAKVNAQVGIAAMKNNDAKRSHDYTQEVLTANQQSAGERVRIHLAAQTNHLAALKMFGLANSNPFASVGVLGGNFTKSEQVGLQNQIKAGQNADTLIGEIINNPSFMQDETRRKQLQEAVAAVEGPGGRLSKMVMEAFDVGQGKGLVGQALNFADVGNYQRDKLREARKMVVQSLRNSFRNHGATLSPAANQAIPGLYQPEDKVNWEAAKKRYGVGQQPPAQAQSPDGSQAQEQLDTEE